MTRALLEKARAALVKSMMASGGETGCDHSLAICFCEEQDAIEAITAELAKPDAEPVAWMTTTREFHEYYGSAKVDAVGYLHTAVGGYAKQKAEGTIPLYARPAHTEAEVAEILACIEPHLMAFSEPVVRRILGVPAPEDK